MPPPTFTPTTPLTLDGALATELEAAGHALTTRLWSAAALRSSPSAILAVHRSYFNAGAKIATTASYQASFPGLRAAGYTDGEAAALVRASVELAREAAGPDGLVAGSVGPYGAFLADGSEYTGRYALGREAFKDFHRERVRCLVAAGVDLLALETVPNMEECRALVELLREEFAGVRAWLSVTVRRRREAVTGGGVAIAGEEVGAALERVVTGGSVGKEVGSEEGEEVVLSDGSNLKGVAELVEGSEQVVAVGVNCVSQELVVPSLRALREGTRKPLVVYPNSGEVWDAEEKVWRGDKTGGSGLEERVEEWWREGARWIGGCCRMGPKDIAVINRVMERLQKEGK
ncbi:homocysteine methyltransferase [Neofusicoccum parvum]|nr:homocysteine methyltransferase [Neofusicoccum parvum]